MSISTMSEIVNSETATDSKKPVQNVKFPLFSEPADKDFDDDLTDEEKKYYKAKFTDLNTIKTEKLHCTACDRHLGCSIRNDSRMRVHPMLRTLMCHTCHSFYNSGEFEKGDDGSELYCRWCGQGGQVYCCSNCPHVFCAKCIKRNLGAIKIKEIENTDDWKCFKCNPQCIWNLRSICWALLRYCEQKNKIIYETVDPDEKENYEKEWSHDISECCRNKLRKRDKLEVCKKKEKSAEKEPDLSKKIAPKIPSTIQVKKFASMCLEESPKIEKKSQKRAASPKFKPILLKNPMAITGSTKISPPVPTPIKKVRFPNTPINTIRIDRNTAQIPRTKAKHVLPISIMNSSFNGFNNTGGFSNMATIGNDNINLSLESLTQGLDMAAVARMSQQPPPHNDDVVCTPDFPLEPMCEVNEEIDDDVQCMTPGPVAVPKLHSPPPLVPRLTANDIPNENVIQMTENDVTVNSLTGGLKFRVDPQTLSSNKMYRLPDGRVFAINPNPNMPGGYSATIVAVTENAGKVAPKGATYAAKLNPLPQASASTSTPKSKTTRQNNYKTKYTKSIDAKESRRCDLKVPVEWFRYNLVDAVDALEYSLSRLHKLKKEATTMFLRTRNIGEIRTLHRSLERLLNTSSSRFIEIRNNLNKEMKHYLIKKAGVAGNNSSDDDDDDVEILPDLENDDPIFIDENSMECTQENENREVDLTGAASSEHTDSAENLFENKTDDDPLFLNSTEIVGEDIVIDSSDIQTDSCITDIVNDEAHKSVLKTNVKDENGLSKGTLKTSSEQKDNIQNVEASNKNEGEIENKNVHQVEETHQHKQINEDKKLQQIEKKHKDDQSNEHKELNEAVLHLNANESDNKGDEVMKSSIIDNLISVKFDDKLDDTEMSEEMIETLLKDDNETNDSGDVSNLDIPK